MLPLFAEVPEGLYYRDDFISPQEERSLLDRLRDVEFSNFEMRGAVARRRVAFFGKAYLGETARVGPMPEFLEFLRARIAEWAGVPPKDFAMALINEYRAGAPIGWHRDAPQYGLVAGVSLGSACRMRFRPYLSPKWLTAKAEREPRRATHELPLAPRSAYLMTGISRSGYEHNIPPVEALRYSVTFRTLRSAA